MRRLPWHVVVRADRRAMFSMVAVALTAAFGVTSFTIPGALGSEEVSPDGPLARVDLVVARPGGAEMDAEALGQHATLVRVAHVRDRAGASIEIMDVRGPRASPVLDDEVRPRSRGEAASIVLVGRAGSPTNLTYGEPLDDPLLLSSRLLVSTRTFEHLADTGEVTHYALLPTGAAPSGPAGTVSALAPAAGPFLASSAKEVAKDLLLVLVFCTALTTLFTYEFMRSEVRRRRPEIALWRGIGMNARVVAILLTARAAFLSAVGGVAGATLAIVLVEHVANLGGLSDISRTVAMRAAALVLPVLVLVGSLSALPLAIAAGREEIRWGLEAPR